MKRLFTLLLLSFAALSCEMIDEKLDDLLDKRDWVVFAEGTELSVDVPSKQTVLNYKFESALDWEVKTDTEWLEIDPMSGKAGKDIKIQIKVAKNKDKDGRTGYVDLTLSNDESYRITINQAGEGDENDDIVVDIPNNQIWYTSTDGKIVEPYSGEYNEYADAFTTFGVNIVSNTYVDGKGVIEFEGDVTIIGYCAFYNCDSLTSVTIPDSVTTIGEWAFASCRSLTSVTIGDSVTTIGSYAFYNCGSLTSVTIPDSVTTIGDYAFAHCSSLTSVTIPDSVTTIGNYAFAKCSSLTSVTIPDSVTTIGEAAFVGCSSLHEFKSKFASEDGKYLIIDGILNSFAPAGLTEYTIPDSVTTIGDYAFGWCESLTSVTIPNSITTIGDWVFYNCTSLTSVTIGDSVTTIGYAAFYNCWSLTSVTIGNSVTTIGDYAFLGCSSLASVTIGDSVTTIGDGAFWGCWSLTSVTIPDSVTTIGDRAFYYCSSLTSVFCKAINPPTTIVNNNGYWYGFAKEDESGNICNIDCTIYVPAESVEAYKSAQGWSEYADAIVGYDFDRNEEVVQPEQPKEIPKNQIWYTSIYGEIVEPFSGEYNNYADALTTFGVNIVSNTYVDGKGVIEFDGDVTMIGDWAFWNCYRLTSVTIPDSVTTIGSRAFYGCSSLTSVTIPNSVTTIGDYAFYGCGSLQEFNGKFASEDGRCLIIDGVLNSFAIGCGATEYTIPDSVTEIGEHAFDWCTSLTSVTIPDSVTTIGIRAFGNCTSLTSVTISDSVTTIGIDAFWGCDSLTSVTIPDSVTSIGNFAFWRCSSLTSVTIGDSVTEIGGCAFGDCNSLTSVTIPDSVTTIGSRAFSGCRSLTSVYITDLPAWCKINFGDYSANPLCYAKNLYLNNKLVTDLVIPSDITEIKAYAFYGCSSLTSVTIPDSVTEIGGDAFWSCDSLKSVTIGNSVTEIGQGAFRGCENLEAVHITDLVSWCNIDFINPFTDGGIDISANPLCYAHNLYLNGELVTDLVIPDGVNEIKLMAFTFCESIKSVTIPDSVTTIGYFAFCDCSSLTSVTIGNGVTTIEGWAFSNYSSLTSVYCKAITPPAGGSSMFYSDASGRKIYVPMESVEAYKSASYWSEYADDIVGYNF